MKVHRSYYICYHDKVIIFIIIKILPKKENKNEIIKRKREKVLIKKGIINELFQFFFDAN